MASDISDSINGLVWTVRFGSDEPSDAQILDHLQPGGEIYKELQRCNIIGRNARPTIILNDAPLEDQVASSGPVLDVTSTLSYSSKHEKYLVKYVVKRV